MEIRKLLSMVTPALILGALGLVVAAVLYPVFAQSRQGSRHSCLSQMKQLGLGMLMYQEDYDGRFPRAAEWMDATTPYTRRQGVYRCPSIDPVHKKDFGYAFNSALELKPLEKHQTPANVVTLYDSNSLLWNANAPNRSGIANPPRHSGHDTFGYADGHAKMQLLVGSGE